jgi:hypothetical protein
VWTILTGLSIFAFIIFGSIDKLNPQFQNSLPFFIILGLKVDVILISCLEEPSTCACNPLINEKYIIANAKRYTLFSIKNSTM